MEETDFDIIFGPCKIIVTKKSLRIVQTDFGQHRFEMGLLFEDVIGAALVRHGEVTKPQPSNEGSGTLIALCAMFGSIAYAARTSGLGDVDFVLPTLIAGLCLVILFNRQLPSGPPSGMGFGLRIQMRSRADMLIPCPSRKQVMEAVSAIHTFLFSGAYYRQVVVRSDMLGMTTILEKHTD